MRMTLILLCCLWLALAGVPDTRPVRERHVPPLGTGAQSISREEARRLLAVTRRQPPRTFEDYTHVGLAYLTLGDAWRAMQAFERAARLRPWDARAHRNRARGTLALEDYETALEAASRAVALDPQFAEAYVDRALAYSMLHRHEEALRDLNHALTLRPELAQAWLDRGITHDILGRPGQAQHDRARALRLDPRLSTTTLDE